LLAFLDNIGGKLFEVVHDLQVISSTFFCYLLEEGLILKVLDAESFSHG
jgi:hypothetical protein